jgi:hypothetical protein
MKEEIPMENEEEKAIEKDQETIEPAGDKKAGAELSEEDLKKVTGGGVDYYLNIGGIQGTTQSVAPKPLELASDSWGASAPASPNALTGQVKS